MRIVCLSSRKETRSPDLHPLPDAGAGEGVPLQPLPDQETADRNRPRTLSLRAPDQDLVPEPAHEVEEGEQEQGRRRHGRHGAGRRWRRIHGRHVLPCPLSARRPPDRDLTRMRIRPELNFNSVFRISCHSTSNCTFTLSHPTHCLSLLTGAFFRPPSLTLSQPSFLTLESACFPVTFTTLSCFYFFGTQS